MINLTLSECDIKHEFDIAYMIYDVQYAFAYLCDVHIYDVLFTELWAHPPSFVSVGNTDYWTSLVGPCRLVASSVQGSAEASSYLILYTVHFL